MGGFIDYFYLTPTTGTDEQPEKAFAVRDGKFIDLSGDGFVTVKLDDKLSTETKTSSDHLVQYTNIMYRFKSGFELNITEDMISGVNYHQTGLQRATVTTPNFYGEAATFSFNVLVIE